MLTMAIAAPASGRKGGQGPGRFRRIVPWFGALCCLVLFAATSGGPLFAEELYLTGVVKSINRQTGIVYVEVLSSSCQGLRSFRADKPDVLEKYLNEKISFFIDSMSCHDNTVHTIVVSRGVRK